MPPPAVPSIWTIKSLLNWTTGYFSEKGIESPRLDAQILLAHVMGCPKIELIARSNEEPPTAEKTRFRELIQRRIDGWPVAYLVGQREFFLHTFEVSPAVLIPRPDTETLVLAAEKALKNRPTSKVLDLGTGSGCIAVSLAYQCKSAGIIAVDISPDAIAVARRNARKLGVADRIEFRTGDLFQPVEAGERFDAIVSNPPYIATGEFAELAVDVRDHEPRVALDGGPDGLQFYRRIAAEAAKFLKPGGHLLVEIGWTQEPAVRTLFEEAPGLTVGESIKDLGGRFRVVTAKAVI